MLRQQVIQAQDPSRATNHQNAFGQAELQQCGDCTRHNKRTDVTRGIRCDVLDTKLRLVIGYHQADNPTGF